MEKTTGDQENRAAFEEEIAICRDAHTHLLTILDSLDVIVYVADMETYEVLYVNKYTKDLFGDLTGKICWQTMQAGQTGPCAFCTNEKLIGPDGALLPTYAWEFRNSRDNRWYEIRDKGIRWVDGRIVRLEIATDCTDKKRLEEERYQMQKLDAVGTLAGGIAHDFNNILSAIIGYNELALHTVSPEHEVTSLLEGIRKAGRRAKHLVDQILTFSRKSYAPLRPVQISPVVKESVKLLRTLLPTTIAVRQHIGSGLGAVMADPGQIYQIIMNLGTNAHRAIAPDKGEIRVDLDRITVDARLAGNTPGLHPGPYLVLTVADSGCGLSAEQRQRIFDPFYTTKERAESTGLGLSVVLGIVKNSGGTIEVESSPGEGSCFRLYFPVVQEEHHESAVSRWLPRGKERILFVEDDEPLAVIGKQMLKYLGYEVTVAAGGQEALEIFGQKGQWFDLVITDLTMPGFSGLEFAAEIHRQRPGLPVIISTGYISQTEEEQIGEAGIETILIKPYELSDLAAAVRGILDKFPGRS